MEFSWTTGPYEFMGERFDGVECAATRLCVSDDPVVGWEMGLGVGDDLDGLEPGKRVEFGSDANIGCFADAERAVPHVHGRHAGTARQRAVGRAVRADTRRGAPGRPGHVPGGVGRCRLAGPHQDRRGGLDRRHQRHAGRQGLTRR
ncbi:DUF4241 domain-containing protein [Streptomyces sp. MBT62]|nr:DUF4241 domain-containing protein [Streptomyces sp. MBT62]